MSHYIRVNNLRVPHAPGITIIAFPNEAVSQFAWRRLRISRVHMLNSCSRISGRYQGVVIAGVHRIILKLKDSRGRAPLFSLLGLRPEPVRIDIHCLGTHVFHFFKQLPRRLLSVCWSCLVPNGPGLKQISTMRLLLRRRLRRAQKV